MPRLMARGEGRGRWRVGVAYLEETLGNVSEADMDELLVGSMLADSDAETGDDEFGADGGEEPKLGDEEGEE